MVGGLHSRDRHRHQPTKMQMHLVAKKSTRAQECCGAPVSTGFPSLQVQSGSQRSSQIFLLSLPVVRVVLQDLCRYYVVRSTTVLSAFWTCLGAT